MTKYEPQEARALKVTTDASGIVWYLTGNRLPCSSKLDIPSFIGSPLLSQDSVVRVVGTANNAALLKALYEERVHTRFQELEVGSPRCCEAQADQSDPEVLLYCMRKFNLPPSLGGWHVFTLRDYPSYALSVYHRTTKEDIDYVQKLMAGHPAWPSLSFIETIDMGSCSQLIALLLDPRWYVDPWSEVEAVPRVAEFLGLGNGRKTDESTHRYRLAVSAWKGQSDGRLTMDGPRNFLWRLWAAKNGGIEGDIIATSAFIEYLCLTWMHALHIGMQCDSLFVPEHYFLREEEAAAYRSHVKRCQ